MMSSPIVDCVREIPLIVERDYPMESENTGFPFDDDHEDGNAAFRSQLDDIAARHPEFAHHLGSFPFRSGTRARSQIPEEFTQRFTERPFQNRFERFGFPFDEPAGEEENKPYYQRYPQYYPQDSKENQEQAGFSGEESQCAKSEVQEEGAEQEETGRGRKLKNIQQSNTVDLGQRQEPVDDRNQRSMSAPPPNNRPRFVSSINIPVNQPAEGSSMPQPSAPPQPQERVIPIHVEGRDEPIIPKRSTPNTSQPHVNPQQSQPHTDKFFTQKSPNFSQYFNRDPNFQNNWFSKNPQNKQPQAHAQTGFNQSQRGRSPQPQPKQEATPPPANVPEQTDAQQKHVPSKSDPIDQIKSIQKDVSELMAEVDKFDGKPKDKKYLYLDEMLTRNLIKLDNIDTQGQENIRLARKEAIKCIEKCISILESKANSNVKVQESQIGEDKESKEMEVVSVEDKNKKQEMSEDKTEDSSKSVENTQQNNPSDERMEVDAGKRANSDGSSEQHNETESKDSNEQVEGNKTSEEKMETSEPNKENGQISAEMTQDNRELKQEKIDNSQNTIEEIDNRTEHKEDKDEKVADEKA